MKILKIEPGKSPVEMEIDGSLEPMQAVVGGMIQAVFPFHEEVALICNEEGKLTAAKLGLDLEKGEVPQVLVPKGMIFGSAMEEEGFSLVGCMVSPCFKYEEFELFDRKELLEKYPEHREVILRLTRE